MRVLFFDFENAPVSGDIFRKKWRLDRVFLLLPAGAHVAQYLLTLMEFPPRQRPASITAGDVMEKLEAHRKELEVGSGEGVK